MATIATASDAVVVEQVQVAYGLTLALDGIGVRVAPGATRAVLGHNGAGKTSLVRVMTAIRPHRGRVVIDGVDAIEHPAEVRRRIGVTGQYAGLDDFLTTGENLELVGRLVGLRGASGGRARDLVEATIPAHRIRELPRRPDATEPVEHGRVGVSFVLPEAAAAAQLVGAVAASSIELTDLDVSSPQPRRRLLPPRNRRCTDMTAPTASLRQHPLAVDQLAILVSPRRSTTPMASTTASPRCRCRAVSPVPHAP